MSLSRGLSLDSQCTCDACALTVETDLLRDWFKQYLNFYFCCVIVVISLDADCLNTEIVIISLYADRFNKEIVIISLNANIFQQGDCYYLA